MNYTHSINYALKWQHRTHPQYKWSKCGKLFNTNTGKMIRKTVNGGSVGYWIAGEFKTLQKLKSELTKIELNECPF